MACGWPEDHLGTGNFWRAVVVELVATCLLVLVGCGSIIAFDEIPFSVERIALTFGLAIAALAQATCNISGGHINPAVTLAMLVCRKIGFLRAAFYIIAQLLGALMGSLLLKSITPEGSRGNLGANTLGAGLNSGQGFGCEFLLTFLLVFVIFSATDENGAGNMAPLCIGLTVAVAHLMGIPFSGASMNPARSFGPAVVSNTFSDHWIYWFGPFLGGPLAGIMYQCVFKLSKENTVPEEAPSESYDADKIAKCLPAIAAALLYENQAPMMPVRPVAPPRRSTQVQVS